MPVANSDRKSFDAAAGEDKMKRIAVVTSGGDASGMNAAIRAVARTAIDRGWEVLGVRHGYAGLIGDDFVPLGPRSVSGIIQHGGTMLGTARCEEFKQDDAQLMAIHFLRSRGVDALVIIGGDGSQTGALRLLEKGFPVVGIASTIDNDLAGAEITLGVDTALNVALEAIDRLKVTASSHQRAFLVEVMGRNCGYLALAAGVAGGAECVALPEIETDPESIAMELRCAYERGKSHAIAVVAEGAKYNATALAKYFEEHRERLGFELRAVKLGHVQRGGTPGVFDRILGTRMGAAAVEHLERGEFGMLMGLNRGEITGVPLKEIVGKRKPLDPQLLELAGVLAR
jgi:6-phosphofructokinase 1